MRNCVILGAGRSGTSMLAGMLHGAGYFMGQHLLDPTVSNPKGYFESAEVNALNDDLIASVVAVRPRKPVGYLFPWRLPSGLLWLADLDSDVTIRATPEQLSRMRGLLATEPYCFKDPRFCYTLGAWRGELHDVVFLCVFREPGRTAVSMKRNVRDEPYRGFHLTKARALRVWTSMYGRALEEHSRHGSWLFLHYDQILDGSAIPRIESSLQAPVDAAFVDRALKRSEDDAGALPPLTREVYRRLCDLAETH